MIKKKISDSELMKLIQQEKRLAFTIMYQQYSPPLYGFILRMAKEEQFANKILLSSFAEIWKNIKFYNSTKGSLFIWMMNITRTTLCHAMNAANSQQKTDCSSLELIYYKGMNCLEASKIAGTTESVVKMDLRKAFRTAKLSD